MSKAPPQEPKEKFIPVESSTEQLGLLKKAVSTAASTLLWQSKNDEKAVIKTYVSAVFEEDGIFYAWIPPSISPKEFKDALIEKKQKQCYFSISLPHVMIFLKADFIEFNDDGFKFKLPSEIFKVQRRQHFRLPIPDGYVIYLNYQDPAFSEQNCQKKLIDLSEGGLSFQIDSSEEIYYRKGMIIENAQFRVRDQEILCDIEIRYIRAIDELKKSSPVKIGVMYKKIEKTSEKVISSYVFEESRKYFSKFLNWG